MTFSPLSCGAVDKTSVKTCKVVDYLVHSASLRGFQSGLSLLRTKPEDSGMSITDALFVCLLPNRPAFNTNNIKSTITTNTTDYNI